MFNSFVASNEFSRSPPAQLDFKDSQAAKDYLHPEIDPTQHHHRQEQAQLSLEVYSAQQLFPLYKFQDLLVTFQFWSLKLKNTGARDLFKMLSRKLSETYKFSFLETL